VRDRVHAGDSGEVGRPQAAVADLLLKYHALFPFEFVLMVGDNTYDPSQTMTREFEAPFKELLNRHVQFFAVLGNHHTNVDVQVRYEPFNMGGAKFYAFQKQHVQFFALNSARPDRAQLDWIDKNLPGGTGWKIAFFHHPLYSSGFHAQPLTGKQEQESLRAIWEPRFCEYGVDVVFTGHEHYYERIVPQHGIQHFVSGASSKLREKDVTSRPPTGLTAKQNDVDYSFMLVEISSDTLFFQNVSMTGRAIDTDAVRRVPRSARACPAIEP
jgi:hypothetical protein